MNEDRDAAPHFGVVDVDRWAHLPERARLVTEFAELGCPDARARGNVCDECWSAAARLSRDLSNAQIEQIVAYFKEQVKTVSAAHDPERGGGRR